MERTYDYMTKSYISIQDLTSGADFGAQMMVLAGLYSVSKITGHIPAINSINEDIGYRLKIKPEIFKNFYNKFEKLEVNKLAWINRQINTGIFKDESIYDILPIYNYNFPVSFSTYHYWHDTISDEIKELYEFSNDIQKQCSSYIKAVKNWGKGKEIVGVHFRRGDYLSLSSLKLSLDYYYDALKNFDNKKHTLLLFSNNNVELEWVENNFKPEGFELYTTDHGYPGRLDMCLMSLCDHMIIANSSYSWWGAYLNKNINKQIICPYNYLNVPDLNFINGNYFPKEWKSIQTT